MPQIINDPGRWAPSGFATGQVVGEGLAALAAHKIGQLNEKNVARKFEQIGFSPEEASIISRMTPSQQSSIGRWALEQLPFQGAQNQSQALAQQLSVPQQKMQQQPQVPLAQQVQQSAYNQAPRLEELFRGLQQPLGEQAPFLKQLAQQLPQQQFVELPQAQLSGIQALPQYQQSPELQQQMAQQMQPQVSPTSPVPAEVLQEIEQPEINQQQKTAQELLKEEKKRAKEEAKAAKIKEHEEKKESIIEKKPKAEEFTEEEKKIKGPKPAQKPTQKYYDETTNLAKAAKNNNLRLDRMTQLIDAGNLSYPALASLVRFGNIKVFGTELNIDLTSLLTADSQEFDKLSKDFLKDAKHIFGSRMTDLDLKNFLKTVPDLVQSDEGKKRVIRDLKIMNDGAILRKDAMDEIIKKYGYRPLNIDALVENKVGPEIEALSKEFIEGQVTPRKLTKEVQNERINWLKEQYNKPIGQRFGAGPISVKTIGDIISSLTS